MMNIKLLKPVVHGAKILAAGALKALEDKVAEDLIKRGLAVKAPAAAAAAATSTSPATPTEPPPGNTTPTPPTEPTVTTGKGGAGGKK